MDKQRIFDVTVAFLAGQHRQSTFENESTCAYRGAGGARCAVGLWIPDAKYDPRMEGRSVIQAGGLGELIRQAFPFPPTPENLRLMSDLQTAHDCFHPFEYSGWLALMRVVAEHHLDTAVLQAVWTGKRA